MANRFRSQYESFMREMAERRRREVHSPTWRQRREEMLEDMALREREEREEREHVEPPTNRELLERLREAANQVTEETEERIISQRRVDEYSGVEYIREEYIDENGIPSVRVRLQHSDPDENDEEYFERIGLDPDNTIVEDQPLEEGWTVPDSPDWQAEEIRIDVNATGNHFVRAADLHWQNPDIDGRLTMNDREGNEASVSATDIDHPVIDDMRTQIQRQRNEIQRLESMANERDNRIEVLERRIAQLIDAVKGLTDNQKQLVGAIEHERYEREARFDRYMERDYIDGKLI